MKKMFKISINYLLSWIIVAVITGFMGATSVYIIKKAIILLHDFIFSYISPYLAPLMGGVLMAFVFSKINSKSMGMGTDEYINTINNKFGDFDNNLPFVKMLATITTLGFNGSGGLVGPTLLIGSSLSSVLIKSLSFIKETAFSFRRTFSICGAAAAMGALFEIPISGGILAVEILTPASILYDDLFPAIMASTTGYIVMAEVYEVGPLFNLPAYEFNIHHIFSILLTSIAGGILGLIFVTGFKQLKKLLQKQRFNKFKPLFPVIGSGLTIATAVFFGKGVLSLGKITINDLLLHDNPLNKGFKLMIGKGLATIFTVGMGNSGGVIGPALFMGAALGNIMSHFCKILPCALAAAGISAATASISNIPVAAIVMILEIFGDDYITPAVIGGVVGFLIGRPQVVYEYIIKQ